MGLSMMNERCVYCGGANGRHSARCRIRTAAILTAVFGGIFALLGLMFFGWMLG